jgi:hypothetical protein
MRRLIYLAGPITKGNLANNINQATEAFVALVNAGFAPICPHWSAFSTRARYDADRDMTYAIASAHGCGLSHTEWLAVDFALVTAAAAVLRLPGESLGAEMETKLARAQSKPVFDSIEEVVAWGRQQDARNAAEAEAYPAGNL